MKKDKDFLERLKKEVNTWIARGIINSIQKDSILSLYNSGMTEANPKNSEKNKREIHLSHVTAALAALCLAVGLIIFYASNWRKMPPSLKLIQVFVLIAGTYGASLYFFLKEEKLAARIFLNLAMVSFGAGIMLVAQIYHISAHPTNGVLVWAIGAAAMSALMSERIGYYLASLLFFIWNCWELFEYHNPAYAYIIPVFIIAWLFFRLKDKAGMVISSILCGWYYFQVNIYWISESSGSEGSGFVFLMLFFPMGLLLILSGKLMILKETARAAGFFTSAAGWISIMVPLLALSWPYAIKNISAPVTFQPGTAIQTWEYLVFTLLCGAGIYFYKMIQESVKVYIPLLFVTVLFFFLPPGNTSVRMVFTHLSITALAGILLFLTYREEKDSGFERIMAFLFTITFLVVKWWGFMIYAETSNEYKIAYLIGFILFGTVFFLINRTVAHLGREKNFSYPSLILDVLCSALAWLAIYTASFKIEEQTSIFQADQVVVVMIILFIVLSAALYLFLFTKLKEGRMMLYLSMIIFISSGITLFSAGPGVSWIVYSLIFNVLLLISSSVVIYYSTVIQSRMLLNAGIIIFVIHLSTRYFDLFWDMLYGSVLFI